MTGILTEWTLSDRDSDRKDPNDRNLGRNSPNDREDLSDRNLNREDLNDRKELNGTRMDLNWNLKAGMDPRGQDRPEHKFKSRDGPEGPG
ncbi:hypothetical protein CDL15_Pgr020626 [Punica granatum]|uniref:Uncharacterized protein n=1 Tax=Punica granatum TaxID=22663 RepID=A0A218Y2T9_PUNGR|nr:hypothetical protein CDL15_Pgr020626 [Punica granatum]